jgi:hypothetical protein
MTEGAMVEPMPSVAQLRVHDGLERAITIVERAFTTRGTAVHDVVE